MKCNEYETKSGKPIRLWQGDCMELMKQDKEWDLAIVDPPYGIGVNNMTLGNGKEKVYRGNEDWDREAPDSNFFSTLIGITDNQIMWGANNYCQNFNSNSSAWVYWDKGTGSNDFSDGELAYTSFDGALRSVKRSWVGNNAKEKTDNKRMHPTQKPVYLYRWLLTNYAEEDDTILDTHGGSLSLAIACWEEDFELDIIELDKGYYKAGVKRFEEHISQMKMF